MKALCQYRGHLVIAVFSRSIDNRGKCPCCKSTLFEKDNGWLRCGECYDFAILEQDYQRLMALPYEVSPITHSFAH